MAGGRPTDFKPDYARQARLLWLYGVDEEEIADFLGISLETMANWAMEHREFFIAITPSDEDIKIHIAKKAEKTKKNSFFRARYHRANPQARLRDSIRSRLWRYLKGNVNGKLFSRLGYTVDELSAHLESRFQLGMSWENYGKWHVDHIKPCALFDQLDPRQLAECWSLNNLQPLWALDNIRKGASYAGPQG